MSETQISQLSAEFQKSPFWQLLELEIVEFETGKIIIKLPYKKDLDNVRDTIHGGVYMSVLDTAMGMLCRSLGCSDVQTIQMNTQFIKPVIEEEIFATASVISESKNTMLIEGKLFNKDKELIGFSTAAFKVVKQ